jgi:hypothetical protein
MVSQMTVDLSAESFAAVYTAERFDVEAYQALGLDMRYLTDPRPEAPMPRLRAAADAYVVDSSQNNLACLNGRYSAVREAMQIADHGFRRKVGSITTFHSAIIAYGEREPRSTARQKPVPRINPLGRPKIDAMLEHVGDIKLVLVRPTTPQLDPPEAQGNRYQLIVEPETGPSFLSFVAEAALYLTEARIAIMPVERP